MKRVRFFFLLCCLITASIAAKAGAIITSNEQLNEKVYQFEKVEFKISITTTFTNPYDAAEIMLDMIITAPSGKSLLLPCYFESGDATNSIWKARFAAREAGKYSYSFRLTKGSTIVETSDIKTFNALPSAKDGFITKKDNWTFKFDSGKPFRGIGENVCWEARSWEDQKYKYEYILPRLAQNGVNFFRIWMCPWNVPIEWKKVNSTNFYSNSNEYFNPSGVKRLDKLVELSDSLGLHFMMAIDAHGSLISTAEWQTSNYNKVNGGPAANPKEFFSLPAAKAKYKNKIRFLIARWGYSPAIGVWEFFNELDNATVPENIPATDVTAWHTEMSSYFKANDPYEHLVSVSVSHRDIAGLDDVPNIDFNQKHIYKATSNIPSTVNSYSVTYKKPYVIGEFGYEWDWNVNFATIEKENIHDFKIGLWYGMFNTTPILPMSWWWEWFDARNTHLYFSGVREISNQMLDAGNGNFEKISTTFSSDDYAVKCGQQIFVYLHNSSSSAISEKTLSIVTKDKTSYSIQAFNPENKEYTDLGKYTADSILTIENISLTGWEERVLIARPEGISQSSNAPYNGIAQSIPGKIEAENFDEGGENIAFHDLDAINDNNYYRTNSGVDLDTITAGGYMVNNTVSGEWLEYTVEIATTGSYNLDIAMTHKMAGKTFHIEIGGKDISGPIVVANISNTIDTSTISLPLMNKGTSVMKLVIDGSGFDIDFLKFTLTNQAPSVTIKAPTKDSSFTVDATPINVEFSADASDIDGSISKVEFYNNDKILGTVNSAPFNYSASLKEGSNKVFAKAYDNNGLSTNSAIRNITIARNQAPYKGTAWVIPGKIEAEDYDIGGQGIAYLDDAGGNDGAKYRTDDVDVEATTDAAGPGFNVGWINAGEWMAYTVNISATKTYGVEFRLASNVTTGKLHLEIDGQDISGDIIIPNTGGWQKWVSVYKNIDLTAGIKTIKVVATGAYNFNYFAFGEIASINQNTNAAIFIYPNPVKNILNIENLNTPATAIISDISGRITGTYNTNNGQINLTSLQTGMYQLSIVSNNQIIKHLNIIKE